MIFEALAGTAIIGVAALTTATIWSRRSTWVRGAAVAGLFTVVPAIVGTGLFALSHPVPYHPVFMPGGKYIVLSAKLMQDEAIYLWLDFGKDHPRYTALPWDKETAQQLQELMRKRQAGKIPGIEGEFPPFEWSWDRNPPQFHPLPQPVIPIPKLRNDDPLRYERGA
jgi:hypothetical protein